MKSSAIETYKFLVISLIFLSPKANSDSPSLKDTQYLNPDDFENAVSFTRIPTDAAAFAEDDVIIKSTGSGGQHEFQTWDSGRIPYILDLNFDVIQRAEIAKAVLKLQSLTCIQFLPRLTEPDYIYIQKRLEGQGFCSSLVGRMGGEQAVFLTPRCIREGIIIHELMHVLGFEHEHCRTDRDDFVNVTFENIVQNAQYNFAKIPGPRANYAGPYDLGSITHYSSFAFGKSPGLRTMMPKDESSEKMMGQREGLSALDQLKIKTFYNCSAPNNAAKIPFPKRQLQNAGVCKDSNTKCVTWGEAGNCNSSLNQGYMELICPHACSLC